MVRCALKNEHQIDMFLTHLIVCLEFVKYSILNSQRKLEGTM